MKTKQFILKAILVLSFFTFLNFHTIFGQTSGDFRSKTTGNWSGFSSWEKYNGSSWVDAISGEIPGVSVGENISILDGHTITIDETPANSILSLTVGEGSSGSLIYGTLADYTLSVSGNVLVTDNGSFTVNSSTNRTHSLIVTGNLSVGNSATFNMYGASSRRVDVSFNSSLVEDVTISSNGTPTKLKFGGITLDRGAIDRKVVCSIDAETGSIANAISYTNGTWEQSAGTFSFGGTASNQTISVNGKMIISGTGSMSCGQDFIVNAGTFSVNTSGTITIGSDNDRFYNYNGGTTTLSSGTVNVGGRFYFTNGSVTIDGATINVPYSSLTSSTSTHYPFYVALGVSSFTMSGGTLNILTANQDAAFSNSDLYIRKGTLSGGTIIVGDGASSGTEDILININQQVNNVTFNSGTTNIEITGNDLDIDGTLTLSSSGTITTTNNIAFTSNGILKYDGTTEQTTTDAEFPTLNVPNSLTVSNSNGVILHASRTINGAITIDGYLNCQDKTLSGTGTFNLNSGGTIGIADADGINNSTGNIIVSGTKTYDNTANYIFNGSVAQVTGTDMNTTINNIEIINSHATETVSLSNSTTVNGTFTISDGKFEIPIAANFTVNGNSTITGAEALIIKSTGVGSNETGSFIDNGSVSYPSSGSAKVERFFSAERWWYFSPPTSDASSADIDVDFSTANNNRLYFWNETATGTHGWNQIQNTTTDLNVLQGYSYQKFDLGSTTKSFSGSLNTGSVGSADNLTRTSGQSNEGYNLVGNPYPSAIDWGQSGDDVAGWTKTNIETSIWYRTTYDGNTRGYATFNYTGGVATNGGSRNIPAMQAFWVRVSSGQTTGTLTMTNSVRQHNSQAFYKNGNNSQNKLLKLKIDNNVYSDETIIYFNSNAVDGYDDFDSFKKFSLDSEVPQIYTSLQNYEQLAINGFSELSTNQSIPLGFRTQMQDTFNLTVENLENFVPGTQIFLVDQIENAIVELNQNTVYTFSSDVVDNLNRFIIHFSPVITELTNSITDISIFSYEKNIYIKNIREDGFVEIFDILGKKLFDKEISAIEIERIKLNLENQIVIVKIISNNNNYSKKLLIK
ncbi:MAG: hypothetical protein HN704_12485 [Bacteroidetes bacterium]|jgi:hypothetical protein|nr:hypothetical protein [Bacteroidota bacterium]MBT6688017.1 hypothetical protein [Bacteroidota bacterium]MBT7144819.1 hypothetical protein [Bacteroidota bacterium]MBT7492410.1 hypothetical protein [Bacteroidota bacterium]